MNDNLTAVIVDSTVVAMTRHVDIDDRPGADFIPSEVCSEYHVPGCPGPAGGDHECRCGSTDPDHTDLEHPYSNDEAPS